MIPAENALSHARLPAVDDTRVNRTDAPPGFSVAGVDVRVQLFVIDVENELRCSAELGTADQCLLAQVSFDVADDAPTFSGSVQLTFDDAVTAEGRQVPCDFAVGTCFADAFVGTIGNVVVGAFPGVGPGATLRISVLGIDDPAIGFEPIVIQVPPIEEFQPITWDIG